MRMWAYSLPLACFLLYGRDYRGTVEGRTRCEARAALKRRFGMKRVPPGTELAPRRQRTTPSKDGG